MARSTHEPPSMDDFEVLLATSSLGRPDPAADRVAVEDDAVDRVIADAAIAPTRPRATVLATRRHANQVLAWVRRLARSMSQGGRLFSYSEAYDPVAALERLRSEARPGDVLLLCGTNTRAAESLQVLRAARAAGVTTWAVVPYPARGVRGLADELMEIDDSPRPIRATHEAVVHGFRTLLEAYPHRLGAVPEQDMPMEPPALRLVDRQPTTSGETGWRSDSPALGGETAAGLPRRVPQATLAPASPGRDDRPLRVVRDAANIAAHTTGYFRGWRRGQEIAGYAVGGRQGREAVGGWDFTRDGSSEPQKPAAPDKFGDETG